MKTISCTKFLLSTALIFSMISCESHKNSKEAIAQEPSAMPGATQYKPQVLKDTVNGVYHEYYKNGKVKVTGSLKNGKRDGDWSYFYENGKLWSWGEYTEGIRNGGSSVYYETGILKMEGNYLNNRQVGLWKFYDTSGKLIKEVTLK